MLSYVCLQLLLESGSKHQGDSTSSEDSHLAALLEHTVAAVEKLLARKRRKKPSAANIAPLEVIREHPVLISALALLLHHSPQLASERYSTWYCLFRILSVRDEEAVDHSFNHPVYVYRHEEIVSVLCGSCDKCPTPLVEKPHAQFMQVGYIRTA